MLNHHRQKTGKTPANEYANQSILSNLTNLAEVIVAKKLAYFPYYGWSSLDGQQSKNPWFIHQRSSVQISKFVLLCIMEYSIHCFHAKLNITLKIYHHLRNVHLKKV